jgi:queuine/archaeosine tRNA-ribosyltransferase
MHTLRFVLDVTAGARAAITDGELASFKARALERLAAAVQEEIT